jgi:HEAT repeat protein
MQQNRPEQSLRLLNDEQVRRFIADGFIMIDAGLSEAFHAEVSAQVAYTLEQELPHPGDNIVPRVPALNQVCDSPAVQGALVSLLGHDFVFLPHRFPHNSEPLPEQGQKQQCTAFDTQPTMAAGSISASAWHQDSHASCGRTRWHTPRAANVFYFPHDTPLHMGPTRFLAGSHLYATLHDISAQQAVMQTIPAGTVVIAHFDLAHAGSPNNSHLGRYMVKLVALRTEVPTTATWNNRESQWQTPVDLHTHHELPAAWAALWRWMRGEPRFPAGQQAAADHIEVQSLMDSLRSTSQQQRLTALYALAALGTKAVEPLVDLLLTTAGQSRHHNAAGKVLPSQSQHHLDRFFLEGQFTPEDSAIALGCIGQPAAQRLGQLLGHEDPWIRMNAVYALGDAGADVAQAYLGQINQLLFDEEASVIRVTLDALAALGRLDVDAVGRLTQFISRQVPEWVADSQSDLRLAMLEQMRYLSTIVLLNWVTHAQRQEPEQDPQMLANAEAALLHSLKDENGYPARLACMALERCGSAASLRAVIHYLRGRAWDAEQNTRAMGAWTLAHRNATLARLNALPDA